MMNMENTAQKVTVYGAYGHTGKFVVTELLRRGLTPILSGRNKVKLDNFSTLFPYLETRIASTDNINQLDDALDGAVAVINCAGPFLDTATPIIEAALRKKIHYLDVAPEQQSVIDTYNLFSKKAIDIGVVILPAMAFYGGLADLLATAAKRDWTVLSKIDIAIALDSWKPTIGTRLTGKRNTYKRLTFSNKALQIIENPLPARKWEFQPPFGLQDVEGFPLSEIISISKHIQVDEINTYINLAPMQDIHNSETPPPKAVDKSGRSSQIFHMEVEVHLDNKIRRAMVKGQDIYAITAPLIVEATIRILNGNFKMVGVVSAGEIFDAEDFLNSLCPENLSIEIQDNYKK
jgi:Saccharopine dehydrogenase NADP binding domain